MHLIIIIFLTMAFVVVTGIVLYPIIISTKKRCFISQKKSDLCKNRAYFSILSQTSSSYFCLINSLN